MTGEDRAPPRLPRLDHGRDEQIGPEQERVVDRSEAPIRGVGEEQGADDRCALLARLAEDRVEIRKDPHPSLDRGTHGSLDPRPEGPRLLPARPLLRVPAEEGQVGRDSNQRAKSSGPGFPWNPPTSGPAKGWPERPRFRAIEIDQRRSLQRLELSPVHVAAKRAPPTSPARERTNGRRPGRARSNPSREARAIRLPYRLWISACVLPPEPRCPAESGSVRPRTPKTLGSFMSFQSPSMPCSRTNFDVRAAHHARVSARVKSGKWQGPGQTRPSAGRPSASMTK
jgi:hypothetical protein